MVLPARGGETSVCSAAGACARDAKAAPGAAAPAQQSFRGGLAGWQEKKIAQYIEEHLLEDVHRCGRGLGEVLELPGLVVVGEGEGEDEDVVVEEEAA